MQIGRSQLLTAQLEARPKSLTELLGLANAVEVEAVVRYAELASLMELRGEHDTAAVFHEMCEIEKRHVGMVEYRAESLHQALPPETEFTWLLPPEIASSWDEVRHSALLTPYRALAIAVVNEERAFALYSYIAAASDNPDVAQEAEALAREELSHASDLRVRRRQAFHLEFPEKRVPAARRVTTLAEFRDLEVRLLIEGAGALRGAAESLETLGDSVSAELVASLARREAAAADGATPAAAGASPTARVGSTPASHLQEALRPLKAASEIYEEVIARADHGDLLEAAQTSLQRVVEGISAIGQRLREVEAHSKGAPL